MASKSEMEYERRKDYMDWVRSMGLWRERAMNEKLSPEERAEASKQLEECIKEKIEMGYDYDYLIMRDDEIEDFRRLEERIKGRQERSNDGEER